VTRSLPAMDHGLPGPDLERARRAEQLVSDRLGATTGR
jgi:hypothetical protein